MNTEVIYSYFPLWLQNVACNYYSHQMTKLRFNQEFFSTLEWLRESQFWSEEKIREYKEEYVKRVIIHAYDTVPYYNSLFKINKLTPKDIRTLEDINKIPILTKEVYRNNKEKLISTTINSKNVYWGRTSGSTGKALEYGLSPNTIAFQWAIWWRFRERFGLKFGDKHLNFVGSKLIIPKNQAKPPYWRYFREQNQYIINMYQLRKEKIRAIVDFINNEDIKFFSGYPSNIYQFSLLVKEAGLSLVNPPQIVLTGGEKLQNFQIRAIQEVCKCRVLDHYGFCEAAGNASRCEHGRYHEDFEFGLLEPYNVTRISEKEFTGEILTTSFINTALPLIRYQVGDIATWNLEKCECGRKSSVITRIEGRVEDMILTPEGLRISRLDGVWDDTDNVVEAQIIQDRIDHVVLRVVKGENFTKKDENKVLRNAEMCLTSKMNIDIEYVDSSKMEKTAGGKFKAIISRIN
ncbi:MAG: hypothetical protein BHV81_10930 [Butyricimonas synergistica]|nr:MAG: hypothetical protein BHV81_10930 [Butyricimonas synergistica]